MTLDELAEHICQTVNQTEPEDITFCKELLAIEQKTLWREALWKDSLVEYTQTLSDSGYTSASTWLPDKQILLVPKDISHVVAVRTDLAKMNVQSSEFFYRRDYDSFANGGTPVDYRLLSPCVWEGDAARLFALYTTATGDSGVVDYLASDGVNITRATDSNIQTPLEFTTERIEGASVVCAATATLADQGGGFSTELAEPGGSFPKRQRIQMIGAMNGTTNLRVLGKRVCPSFSEDGDEPAITGSDRFLIAAATAGMYRRERQVGKAVAIAQGEGGPLLDQLKREQCVQQAHYKQLVPEGGFGEVNDALWGTATYPTTW